MQKPRRFRFRKRLPARTVTGWGCWFVDENIAFICTDSPALDRLYVGDATTSPIDVLESKQFRIWLEDDEETVELSEEEVRKLNEAVFEKLSSGDAKEAAAAINDYTRSRIVGKFREALSKPTVEVFKEMKSAEELPIIREGHFEQF